MLNSKKIVVVMPAYNAARTLRQTYDEVMAHGIVDRVILVDDASQDNTAALARSLDHVQVEVHPVNRGYGANQKNLLPSRACGGRGHRHHDSPRLSIHAEVDSSDGGDGVEWTLSLRARLAHSWR